MSFFLLSLFSVKCEMVYNDYEGDFNIELVDYYLMI
jgi:hypothetical protein